jgi:hypothetical protein
VGEGEVGDDEVVLVDLTGTEPVAPFAVVTDVDAARHGASEAFASETAPCLEDPFEILGPIVDVVVGEEDGLGLDLGVGDELLVQGVDGGDAVSDGDTVGGDKVGGWLLVEVVPDDNDLVQRGDLFAENDGEGAVELVGAVIRLEDDAGRNTVSQAW